MLRIASPPAARSSCGVAELLLVHEPAEHGRHPGALVEAERAAIARRIDAEPDAVLPALSEAPERVAEERRAHTLLAPRVTREEHVDDRVTALGGRLRIESPAGASTVVAATLPLTAG